MTAVSERQLRLAGVFLFTLVLGGFFVIKDVQLVRHYYKIISTSYQAEGPPELPSAGDLTVFYSAGKLAVSNDRAGLYYPDVIIPEVHRTQGFRPGDPDAGDGRWSKYYNP